MGYLSARMGKAQPTQEQISLELKKVTDLIVEIANPRRIYLFGSALTSNFTFASDIDLAILFDDIDQLQIAKKKLYATTLSDEFPCELLFYTVEKFDERGKIGGICSEILATGKRLYG